MLALCADAAVQYGVVDEKEKKVGELDLLEGASPRAIKSANLKSESSRVGGDASSLAGELH